MIDTLGMDPEDTSYDEDMDVLLLKSERRLDMHGLTLGRMIDTLGMDPEDVVLVHDCLFTKFGEWRMEYNQHHNGHPGTISCMDMIGEADFWRLHVGIGSGVRPEALSRYVVSHFNVKESQHLYGTVFDSVIFHLTGNYLAATSPELLPPSLRDPMDKFYIDHLFRDREITSGNYSSDRASDT